MVVSFQNQMLMPELPEVNTVQLYFDEAALDKRIEEVIVHDSKIIRNADPDVFIRGIRGKRFTNSYRQGKYFFGDLEDGRSVLFHLGMTGDFKYYQDQEEPPKYERFVFRFIDGYNLGFDCPRKFARILLLDDRTQYLKQIRLGIDALRIKEKQFLKLAKGKKGTLKGFLMNQRYIAGVGNLYADEICFQSRVHPGSRVDKLSEQLLSAIYQNMQSILSEAVRRLPNYKNYPPDWFWGWRKDGEAGPEGKGVIEKCKIAGRTTFFCNEWQKLYK